MCSAEQRHRVRAVARVPQVTDACGLREDRGLEFRGELHVGRELEVAGDAP